MKAVLKNGAICPEEPLPKDWSEGTELEVRKSTNGTPDIGARYHRFRTQWYAETRVLSDPAKIMANPAMRAIIAMGQEVVPVILRDLQTQPSLMVWGCRELLAQIHHSQGITTQ